MNWFVRRRTSSKFSVMPSSHCSSVAFHFTGRELPALFTRTSRPPSSASTRSRTRSGAPRAVRSSATDQRARGARAFDLRASSSSKLARRATIATRQPSAARTFGGAAADAAARAGDETAFSSAVEGPSAELLARRVRGDDRRPSPRRPSLADRARRDPRVHCGDEHRGGGTRARSSAPAWSLRRIVTAGVIGNVLEWYDFAVYGFFAPILAAQFFPGDDPVEQSCSRLSRLSPSAF